MIETLLMSRHSRLKELNPGLEPHLQFFSAYFESVNLGNVTNIKTDPIETPARAILHICNYFMRSAQ